MIDDKSLFHLRGIFFSNDMRVVLLHSVSTSLAVYPMNLQVGKRYGFTFVQYLCLTPFHSSLTSRLGT